MELSRRAFVGGAALAGGITCAAMGGVDTSQGRGVALADETQGSPAAQRECDVLVVGLGTSGLMAAVGAAKQGASVIAVDRAATLAGTTNCYTHGPFIVGSKFQLQYDNPLTVQEAVTALQEKSNYAYNSSALRSTLAATGRAADILIDDAGFTFDNSPFPESTPESEMINRAAHTYGENGEARAAKFQAMLDANGVECLLDTQATGLVLEEGVVRGALCASGDGDLAIYAKAVVLCTGGFLNSPDLQKQYLAGAKVVAKSVAVCDGAGITMAQSAGAQLGKAFSVVMNEYGGANEKAEPITGSNAFSSPNPGNDLLRAAHFGCLFVDANGRRFVNEGYLAENPFYSGEPLTRQSVYYAILDEAYMSRLETEPFADFFHTVKMVKGAADMVLSNVRDQFAEASEQGWAFSADTLGELAQVCGLAGLEETVEAYNAACEAGADDEFYKDPSYLTGLGDGPFYAIELQPSAYMSLGGIKCNGSCQALDADNKVIAGLYVAGGDADIHTSPYLQNGSANGFALGSGLVAGEAAAAEALA